MVLFPGMKLRKQNGDWLFWFKNYVLPTLNQLHISYHLHHCRAIVPESLLHSRRQLDRFC